MRVDRGDVVVEILIKVTEGQISMRLSRERKSETNDCDGIISRFGHDCMFDAVLFARVWTIVTVTHRRP